ncbi:DUF4129 domain-containing protein [Lipingzhangella sp. LS1_29]|uniref:DUF4129 domain-containing protein n=1 Tax=Lipingzhangella rawalii TaxID=2055835 RepID=A0ABU2H537_9ACTN|nr:DUF4129 domain-containing protein [Lipingzhangella rawalii]MDS1270416.1 DUF4129 domain-containing protein [Lipingzhangella rawalii]
MPIGAGAVAFLADASGTGRQEARRLAREELARPIYAEHEPSLVERLWDLVLTWLARLTEGVVATVPGGWWTLAPLLVLLAALVVALLVYLGPSPRSRRTAVLDRTESATTADQHRRNATEHAAAGRAAAAVRERIRAINRDAEERALIQIRPGRTATELANELAAELPEHAPALHTAARVFNEVTYGHRSATIEDYTQVTQLDEALRDTRIASAAVPASTSAPTSSNEGRS